MRRQTLPPATGYHRYLNKRPTVDKSDFCPNTHACLPCSQISITPPTLHDTLGQTWRVSLTRALWQLGLRNIVFFWFFFLLKIDTIKDVVQQESQNRSTDIRQRSSPVRSEDQSLAHVGVAGRGSQYL